MSNGKLLVFEGIDGSGKSTLSKAVATALAQLALDQWQWATYPSPDTPIGRLIRQTFDGTVVIGKEAMLWLFTAEAVDGDQQTRKLLADGVSLVLDRHALCSAQIYQGEVHSLNVISMVQAPWSFVPPDFLFIVDVPATVALSRSRRRDKPVDLMYEDSDDAAFLSRLTTRREDYLALSWPFRKRDTYKKVILDGTQPLAQLVDQVVALVTSCRV